MFGQFASRYKVRIYPSNRKRTIQLNMTVQSPRLNALSTTFLYNPTYHPIYPLFVKMPATYGIGVLSNQLSNSTDSHPPS